MRLIRNTTEDGRCKYAIVRLDKLRKMEQSEPTHGWLNRARVALGTLKGLGLLEYGEKGSEEECFVIKLKDINAPAALMAYAISAAHRDEELATDVEELAERAACHPNKKQPD